MARTIDIGHRIELVPMDTHFHGISVALYQQRASGRPRYLVHSYSSLDGVDQRIQQLVDSMIRLGAMRSVADNLLEFPCGNQHLSAVRRLFLESCKVPPAEIPQPRPLQIFDKKGSVEVKVSKLGSGRYGVTADSDDPDTAAKRLKAIAGGLVKLGQMLDTGGTEVAFECGHDHDALLGLLLVRAPNVRAAVREQEQVASRGVLAAPSQQE